MIEHYLGLIGETLSATVVFAFCGWQLWSLSRERRRDRERDGDGT